MDTLTKPGVISTELKSIVEKVEKLVSVWMPRDSFLKDLQKASKELQVRLSIQHDFASAPLIAH